MRMLECTCTVPFGMPVEPEEYSQKQGSSLVVGAAYKLPVCLGKNFGERRNQNMLQERQLRQ